MNAFWPSSLPVARSTNVASKRKNIASELYHAPRDEGARTVEQNGDVRLRLRRPRVQRPSLLQINGPDALLAVLVLDAQLEDRVDLLSGGRMRE